MAEITITITADEDDLRNAVANTDCVQNPTGRVIQAIATALPKPRIQLRPGMVLRRKSDGKRFAYASGDGEWEVLLDAEDGAT